MDIGCIHSEICGRGLGHRLQILQMDKWAIILIAERVFHTYIHRSRFSKRPLQMVVTASVTSTSHTVCACSCLLLLLSVWASVGIRVLGFCLQVGSQSVSCKVITLRISHLFSCWSVFL